MLTLLKQYLTTKTNKKKYSYVKILCHRFARKVEKVMKLPLACRVVTLENGRNCGVFAGLK